MLVRGDVSNEDDVVRMVAEAVERLGGIDILVNNAGIQISRPTEELSSADFDRVLAVNLRGSFLCAREAIRHFLAEDKRGSIVNISSVHQLIPKPGYLGYSASKGGMQNLTRTLALEYAGARHPRERRRPGRHGHADQPRLDRRPGQARAWSRSHIPMPRAGDADEMAGVTAFLASDDAAYVTGQTIFVDGGLTLFAELPHALVLGMSSARSAPTTARHAQPRGRREAPRGARASSARAACIDLGRVLDEKRPCSRAATSARRSSPPRTTRTRNGGVGDNARQLDHGAGRRHDAARHAPRRAEPPPDGRPRLQRLDRSPSSPARPACVRLGVETVPQIVTRGWLVDVASRARRRRSRSPTLDGIDPAPGDAVLFHTGWGAHWDDPERTSPASPAPGCEVAEWLAERGVALTGCDTWSYGPVPAGESRARRSRCRRS